MFTGFDTCGEGLDPPSLSDGDCTPGKVDM